MSIGEEMTRPKRAYVAKVKGCYQCSRRRINCDRAQPACSKCVLRGIHCSGLGLRYRFYDDVFSNNTKAQLVEPQEYSSVITTPESLIILTTVQTCHKHTQSQHERYDGWVNSQDARSGRGSRNLESSDSIGTMSAQEELLPLSPMSSLGIRASYSQCSDRITVVPSLPSSVASWEQCLFIHFSTRIAPEMVVIDDHRNGWRHLILPVAHLDELVKQAVLSASAFHFTATTNSSLFDPNVHYFKAIDQLRRRQNLSAYDVMGKQSIILALLVLLTAVMVNGSSEFPTIFQLMESALGAIGGEELLVDGELGLFLVRQVRKYRGYALPFMDEAKALQCLSLTKSIEETSSKGWDCFYSYYCSSPEVSPTLALIHEICKRSCDIYIARVLAGPDEPPHTDLVDRFINALNLLPEGSPGEHVLIFSIFLAASESVVPDQQEHLSRLLLRHHQRSGFGNISSAVEHLRQIWSGRFERKWTEILPKLRLFIV